MQSSVKYAMRGYSSMGMVAMARHGCGSHGQAIGMVTVLEGQV